MIGIAILLASAMQDEPIRLRTLCPNGAVVMVERMPKEPMISVQLWTSSKSVRESKATHGWRHLLEHLLAKGENQNLDQRLEKMGGYLRARTFRDSMQFEVNVGPNQLALGLSTISELMRPLKATETEIAHEIKIMDEEYATYEDSAKFSISAWSQAYGDHGLDAFGDKAGFSSATPQGLRTLQRRQFYPENLVLVVSGPVDVQSATKLATNIVGVQQGAIENTEPVLAEGKPGRVTADAFGEGRAAIVSGFNRPSTMGALAFALSIGSEIEGSFVSYTPSANFGLVLLGQTEKVAGVGLRIDRIQDSEWPLLYGRGRLLAKQWVNRYLNTAQGVGYIRGLLLSIGKGNRPEMMIEAIDALSLSEFKNAAGLFSKERAVTVVGE